MAVRNPNDSALPLDSGSRPFGAPGMTRSVEKKADIRRSALVVRRIGSRRLLRRGPCLLHAASCAPHRPVLKLVCRFFGCSSNTFEIGRRTLVRLGKSVSGSGKLIALTARLIAWMVSIWPFIDLGAIQVGEQS